MIDPEIQQVLDSLEGRLNTAYVRIRELEDSYDAHHGLDNGSDEVDWNTPHRNLSVDTIESGGGVILQDNSGMKIKTNSSTGPTAAIYWIPELVAGIPTALNRSEIIGYTAGDQGVDIVTYNDASNETTRLYTYADGNLMEAGIRVLHPTLGDPKMMAVVYEPTGDAYVDVTQPLRLDTVAADFTNTAIYNGMLWYRTDTNKFRARINGVTENLATETFASAEVTTHTGDTVDAHDASAISVLDTANNFTGTDVEAALAELAAAGGGSMPMPPLVGTENWHCLGTQLAAMASAAPASGANPTANLAYYIPVLVTEDITVTKLWCRNGSVVSGNVNMALYTSAFAQVANSEIGSTAQAGTNAVQEFDITNVALTAGLYYIAIVMDNITGTFIRYGPSGGAAQSWGLAQEAAVFDLPATATPADIAASAFIPVCGIATRTQVA